MAAKPRVSANQKVLRIDVLCARVICLPLRIIQK